MIREANLYDIPAINKLGLLLEDNFDKVYSINEMLKDDYSKIFVYVKDDKVIGFIMATSLYETCDIIGLVVDPLYRHKLVASNLIDYLITDLGEDLRLMTLEVRTKNEAAIKLYEKFGFEVIHVRKKYYGNDDAYLMARESER